MKQTMREALQQIEGVRRKFRGTFERLGEKRGWKGRVERTVLLKNIKTTDGQLVADHLWFNFTQRFEDWALEEGDEVEFEARVTPYVEGYQGTRDVNGRSLTLDYKLSRPTKVNFVWKEEEHLTASAEDKETAPLIHK